MWYKNKDFWEIVDKLGWGRKSTDYNELGKKLMLFIEEKSDINRLRTISKQKRKTIADIIDNTNLNLNLWWGGDDSFWDFTAHIVGMGKDFFARVINDPTTIDEIGKNYVENFEYLFSKCEDYCDTEEGMIILDKQKRIRERKFKLEKILNVENKNEKILIDYL